MRQSRKKAARVMRLTILLLTVSFGIVTVSNLAKLANATTAPSGTHFDHVVIIMMENHSINNTYGTSVPANSWSSNSKTCLGNCTYFDSFANSNGLAKEYTDGGVPGSIQDYIAITSGYGNTPQACNSYVGASGCPLLQIPNVVDRLEGAGLIWRAYMEGYPVSSGCYNNDAGSPYYYTFIHNPFIYYSDIQNNAARCSHIVNANSQTVSQSGCWPTAVPNDDLFINDLNSPSNAPNYMFLTPNTVDDAHDCNDVSVSNAWLNEMVPQILGSSVFKTEKAALFITFDEPGCTYSGCPSEIPELYSVWASNPTNPTTSTSFKSINPYTHYSALRTIEVNWNLASLTSNDANAAPMTEFFQNLTPPLTASFTYSPSSPQAGQQVTFTGSAGGGTTPYSFSWSFGDGSTGTGSSVTHSYSTAGKFAVILTTKDSGSPQQTTNSQQSITVANPPPPALTASFTFTPSNPTVGQPVSFTGSASGGTPPYGYSWTFGDSGTASGSSATHSYQAPGSYTVVLTVTDAGGQTASSTQTVTVSNPPPSTLTASFSYTPASPVVGQQVTFSASPTGGTPPYSFSWSFGDGSIGSGSTVTHVFSSAGTFNVIMIVSDSGSPQQTANSQQAVTVTSPPPPLATSFSYTPTSPQAGQQVTFSGSASGGTSPYTFTWTFGDGSSGIGSTVTHTYTSAGTYTVTLTTTDSGSPQQSVTSRQPITVASSPPPPFVASFSFSPSSPTVGQAVSFAGSASGGISPYSYAWSFGDGGTGAVSAVVHTFQSSGTYTVVLTITDSSGKTATSSQTITVSSPLSASISYSPSNPTTLTPVTFTGSATGGTGPYTYSWDFGDGTTGSGSNVSHSYLLPGTYTVTLTVTDVNGQTATSTVAVTVSLPLV